MRKYGWIPDSGDHRDKRLSVKAHRSLPDKVDLREFCSPVENQGDTNSCVGNATASAIEQLDNRDGEYTDASRLFIYYCARSLRGWEGQDVGAIIRDAIKSMASKGVAKESLWKFAKENITTA